MSVSSLHLVEWNPFSLEGILPTGTLSPYVVPVGPVPLTGRALARIHRLSHTSPASSWLMVESGSARGIPWRFGMVGNM